MRDRLRSTILVISLAAAVSLALTGEAPLPQIQTKTASTEHLKSRVFLILDAEKGVVRKTYAVWTSETERDLDFEWIAEKPSLTDAERVSGKGRLVWRKRGASHYDAAAVVSVYRGTMKDGRAEGEGELRTREGTLYQGRWRGGLYDGAGSLQMPDGASYEGAFKAGRFDGEGRLVQADGETYDGTFVAGLKTGTGKTRLPNGANYTSTWTRGVEDPDSRRVRLAQGPYGAMPVQFQPNDLQISFQADLLSEDDKTAGTSGDPIRYIARNKETRVVVEPDDRLLLGAWNGTGLLSDDFIGWKVGSPVALNVRLKNSGAKPIDIRKTYVEVDESILDPRPMYQLWREQCFWNDGDNKHAETRIIFRDQGWSQVKSAQLEFAFADAAGAFKTPLTTASVKIKQTKSIVYDLRPALKGIGVDVDRLYVECGELGAQACRTKHANAKALGLLAKTLTAKNEKVGTFLVGRLLYTWIDEKKAAVNAVRQFNLFIPLNETGLVCAEAATGAEWDPAARQSVPLGLNRKTYRLPLAFTRVIAPAQAAPLGLAINSEKSSRHRFRLVMETADGRAIRSRDIDLLFIQPVWNAFDTHMNPYEEERDHGDE